MKHKKNRWLGFFIGFILPIFALAFLEIYWRKTWHTSLGFFWQLQDNTEISFYAQVMSLVVLLDFVPLAFFDYKKNHYAVQGVGLAVVVIYLPIIIYLKFLA
jgi:hypothetical protein